MDDMLRFSCEQCGKRMKVPPKFEGRRVTCTGCKQSMIVPQTNSQKDKKSRPEDFDRWKYPDTESQLESETSTAARSSHQEAATPEIDSNRTLIVGLAMAFAIGVAVALATAGFLNAAESIVVGLSTSLALVAILPLRWAWSEMETNGGFYAFETVLVEYLAESSDGLEQFKSRKSSKRRPSR